VSVDHRPTTSKEKEQFSSRGKRSWLILRGQWGLSVDKAIVWATGWSLVTAQYAWAAGDTYVPTLMLWTIGAKSGKIRTACLPCFRVGDALVIRGSNGGGATDPHWVHNVRAHAQAWIRIDRRNRPVHAHVASGEERERIYAELARQSRSTELYAKMCAPRELPLVVLRDLPT
jgi:deazaflavin-dependent oxidoreductase (nitroreductase family)